MKKIKPMLLVMIAAFLMFTSSASAANSRVDASKKEGEIYAASEKLYSDGEQVELDAYFIVPGNVEIYVLFEDIDNDQTILMSQLVMKPGMDDVTSYHRSPSRGYYTIEIRGDASAYASARLKKSR
ncbi:hypothetical protein [Paenibacillus kribbensis]|uniref:hypothetical protein n=1 Tax=Paenibacillus kribbensis TaxID=172713 RepID=UPI0015C0F87B|nr:hypothetical protein [Paenibacillus kribbensis]